VDHLVINSDLIPPACMFVPVSGSCRKIDNYKCVVSAVLSLYAKVIYQMRSYLYQNKRACLFRVLSWALGESKTILCEVSKSWEINNTVEMHEDAVKTMQW